MKRERYYRGSISSRLARLRAGDVAAVILIAGAIVAIAIGASIYIAAGLYAIFFVGLVALRPRVALVFMLTTVPVIHDLGIGPVKLAIGEIDVILSIIPLLLMRRRISYTSPFWIAAALYLAVCALSTASNGMEREDLVALLQMVDYLFLATFVFSQLFKDPEALRLGLFCMVVIDAMLAIVLVIERSDYVLGYHKNAMGDQLCFAVLCAGGLWWTSTGKQRKTAMALLVITATGLLLSLSRGSWAGALAGAVIMLLLLGNWRQVTKLALLATPILALAWYSLPAEKRDYATDVSSDSYNIKARYHNLDNALTEFNKSPMLGVGVGYRKRADATNLFAFILAETGIAGFLAFSVFLMTFAWMVWTVRQRMAPSDPLFGLFVIGTGLMVAKLTHAMFDHYWQRGMLPVWIGAGFVLQAYDAVRTLRRKRRVSTLSKTIGLPPLRRRSVSDAVRTIT